MRLKIAGDFREWLAKNHTVETACWLFVRWGAPKNEAFRYVDAVEEALCFGWIDSVVKNAPAGDFYLRTGLLNLEKSN